MGDGVLARALPLHGAPDDHSGVVTLRQDSDGGNDGGDEQVHHVELHFERRVGRRKAPGLALLSYVGARSFSFMASL